MTKADDQIDRWAHMLDEAMEDKAASPLALRKGMTFDEFEDVVDPKREHETAFFEKLSLELTTPNADFSVDAEMTDRNTVTVEVPLKTEWQDVSIGYYDFGSATYWDDRPPEACTDLADCRVFDKLKKALGDRGLSVKWSYDYENEDLPEGLDDEPTHGFSHDRYKHLWTADTEHYVWRRSWVGPDWNEEVVEPILLKMNGELFIADPEKAKAAYLGKR